MTDQEFRATVQAVFGEEIVTAGFLERLDGLLQHAGVRHAAIYHTVALPAGTGHPRALEIRAKLKNVDGDVRRLLWITAELELIQAHDIRPPHKPKSSEGAGRRSESRWDMNID
jgi:hypothetical protein